MADSRPNQAFKAAPKRQSQILSITTTFGVLKMAQDSRQETRTEAAFICSARLLSSCFFFLFPYPIFSLCLKNLSWEKSSLGGGPWKLPFFSIVFALLLQTTCKTLFFLISQCKANSWGKNIQFLTSTYNCKTRNLLFDFSFHFVFNLHFVGLIYIFFCLDVYIWGCDGFTVTSQWIS